MPMLFYFFPIKNLKNPYFLLLTVTQIRKRQVETWQPYSQLEHKKNFSTKAFTETIDTVLVACISLLTGHKWLHNTTLLFSEDDTTPRSSW